MATREELLQSIRPGMRLTKDFFMSIYADEITRPGFADQALARLEEAGCSRAREYYDRFVGEYEAEHEAMMRRVAEWYRKQNFYGKDVKKLRTQQEAVQRKKQGWTDLSEMLGFQSIAME